MSRAVEMVIQWAGIPLKDADEHIVALAQRCLDQCYYLDRAAIELRRRLGCPV
jgi:hypothetical protein